MHSNFPSYHHKSASVRCKKSINGISLINRRNLFPSMFPILLSRNFRLKNISDVIIALIRWFKTCYSIYMRYQMNFNLQYWLRVFNVRLLNKIIVVKWQIFLYFSIVWFFVIIKRFTNFIPFSRKYHQKTRHGEHYC